MKRIREAIKNECFDKFVINFVRNYYQKDEDNGESQIPTWIKDALAAVNIKFD